MDGWIYSHDTPHHMQSNIFVRLRTFLSLRFFLSLHPRRMSTFGAIARSAPGHPLRFVWWAKTSALAWCPLTAERCFASCCMCCSDYKLKSVHIRTLGGNKNFFLSLCHAHFFSLLFGLTFLRCRTKTRTEKRQKRQRHGHKIATSPANKNVRLLNHQTDAIFRSSVYSFFIFVPSGECVPRSSRTWTRRTNKSRKARDSLAHTNT